MLVVYKTSKYIFLISFQIDNILWFKVENVQDVSFSHHVGYKEMNAERNDSSSDFFFQSETLYVRLTVNANVYNSIKVNLSL